MICILSLARETLNLICFVLLSKAFLVLHKVRFEDRPLQCLVSRNGLKILFLEYAFNDCFGKLEPKFGFETTMFDFESSSSGEFESKVSFREWRPKRF